MRKFFVLIATIGVMCFTCFFGIGGEAAFAGENQGFKIDDYVVTAQVHENNTIDITETIKVDFYQHKHGIYRNIPIRLNFNSEVFGGPDKTYSYGCKVKNIDVPGREWSDDESDSYNKIIRIGDSDRLVYDKQTYRISYTYIYTDDRIEDFDFLYHNILGTQWKVPIKNFAFEMKFDKELPKESLDGLKMYGGYAGSTSNSMNFQYKATANKLHGGAFDINPGQGITVLAELPEGYYTGEKSSSPILPIIGLLIALAGIVLAVLNRFRAKGKKPVVTVEFHPPKDMPPAEVGTIMDESADIKDLLSMIPWFGTRGYLTAKVVEIPTIFKRTREVIALTKVKDLPDDAPEYQKKMFELLFEDGDARVMDDLGEDFGERFFKLQGDLKNEFKGARKLSAGRGKAYLASAIITVGAAIFFGFSSTVSILENIIPGIMAIAFVLTTFIVDYMKMSGKHKVVSIICIAICLIIELGMIALFCTDSGCMFPGIMCFIVFALCAIGSIMAAGIVVPTDYKVEMIGKIRGLREFIKVAEMDKLNMLTEENPDYFFDILPFAMVFGLEEKWSKHFEKIKLKAPSWYDDRHNSGAFSTMAFCSMLNDNVRSSVSSAVSAANSSGGGGSAGGGGGGGGGGSW